MSMDKDDLTALLVDAPAEEVDQIHRLLHEWSVGPDSSFPVQLALLTKAQWRIAANLPRLMNDARKLIELHLGEYRRQSQAMADDFAGDRVDYVVVHNPAKVRTNLFKKSNIEAELKKFGAKELTLPVVTSITLLAIKRAEAKAARKLSFAEVATPGSAHLELMLAGEMQWAMQQMFRQYDAIADLLVPSEQVPDVEPQPEPEAKPARSKQPMLNLGE